MRDFPESTSSIVPPEADSVQRLLAALGEWGVAEVQGAPEPMLEHLEDVAKDAYLDVSAVA